MHGFLNLNKPAGLTSHDVVVRVRRLVGRKVKVGHAGTLDPAATGVLPVALGHATRLIEYLTEARKGYRGLVRLGVTTTTDDAEGEALATCAVPPLTDAQIEAALAPMRGAIMQVPPMYSALHHDGQRLYDLARAGQTVELDPRPVMIYALTWARVADDALLLTVECGKGTYIRALARDLGTTLGCGAHLAALERTFVGSFRTTDALPLDALLADPARLPGALLPPETAVADWPVVHLDAEAAHRISTGLAVQLCIESERVRAHGPSGNLLALLYREATGWHPAKVFLT